jgi:predicted phosphodiesterase
VVGDGRVHPGRAEWRAAGGGDTACASRFAEIRGARRQRHRRTAGIRRRAADGRGPRGVSIRHGPDARRQHVRASGSEDFVTKFERPYAALLKDGVLFYATLGNHDDQNNRFYKGFNMGGERYFTFVKKNVRFFVLDTNQLDPKQRDWLDTALQQSDDQWRICYFHHPLYSDAARHGSDVSLRVVLEPLFVKYGIDVVFSGHDHVYERLKPQKGITYFVSGSGGALRKGDVRPSAQTAAYYDQEQSFMLVEVAGDDLYFEAINRSGAKVDSGVIHRQPVGSR